MTATALEDKEQQAKPGANNPVADDEKGKVDAAAGNWKTDVGNDQQKKKGLVGRLTGRQKGTIFILLALAGSGGVGIFTVLQGPFQFIHFGQVVAKHFDQLNNVMDDQQLSRVRYKKRLGTVGNKAADIVESKLNSAGYTSRYNSAGSFIGFSIDPQKVNIEELRSFGADIDIDATTGELLLTENGTNFKRRRLVKGVLEHANLDLIPSRISSRLLRKRGGISFKVLGNLDRKAYETRAAFQDEVLKKFKDYVKNGTSLKVRSTADDETQNSDEVSDEDKDKNKNDSDDFQKTIDDIAADPSDGNVDRLAGDIDAGKLGAKSTDALGIFCAVRAIGNAYQATLYARLILPLIRVGVSFTSISSQVMGNKVTVDELGAFNKLMYDEKENTSWASARSIQYELGQEQTGPDMPTAAKPGRVGQKPLFFSKVDDAFDNSASRAACKFNDNAAGGLAISLFTGGFVTDAFFTALGAAGIDPIGKLIQGAIGYAVGSPLKDLPSGALLGNYVNYGAKLGSIDQTIAVGGGVLSDDDAAILRQEQRAVEQEAYAHLPLKDKLFNMHEPRSLASRAMFSTPELSSGNIAHMFSSLIRSPTKIFSGFTFKKAFAATSYDYGIDNFGFSRADQDNPKFADPYAVENYVQEGDRLKDMNEKYGKCFSTTIDPDTKQIKSGRILNYYEDEYQKSCKKTPSDSDYEYYTYFRFYLLGKVTERAVECYGGYEESCDQVGYGAGGPDQSSPAPGSGTTNSGVVGDMGQSSDTVSCAEGTKDLGVVESKYTGEAKNQSGPIKIRLCQLSSIGGSGQNTNGQNVSGGAVVNSRVSGAWQALGTQAKQSSLGLSATSSFRLNDSCGGTGTGTLCADPGKSYHQLGVAIDFAGISHEDSKKGSPESCSRRGKDPDSAVWNWLYKNAETFGFKQYSYEPWHWDPAPRSNRCGAGT